MDTMSQQQLKLDKLLKESGDVREYLILVRDRIRAFESVENGFNSNKMTYALVILLEDFMKNGLAKFESGVSDEKRILNNSFQIGSQLTAE